MGVKVGAFVEKYALSATEETMAATRDAKSTLKPVNEGALRTSIVAFLWTQRDYEDGCTLAEVCDHLPHVRGIDINAILKQLIDEGEAFHTSDENHYRLL